MGTARSCTAALVAVLALGATTSCSGSGSKAKLGPAAPTTTIPGVAPLVTAAPPTPKGNATEAVTALLSAEKANDHTASFGVLDAAARAIYPTVPDWERRRTELAPITSFRIESTKGDDVTALVDHEPGIDPFIGLHFAHEHQTWHAVKEQGGWGVDPDPKVVPILPADEGARTAAVAWGTALQACDNDGAAKYQTSPTLLGASNGPALLCHAPGPVTASAPSQAPQGPQTADLVAQYTVDILTTVKVVKVSGGAKPFDAFLVPIGDVWKVVSVSG